MFLFTPEISMLDDDNEQYYYLRMISQGGLSSTNNDVKKYFGRKKNVKFEDEIISISLYEENNNEQTEYKGFWRFGKKYDFIDKSTSNSVTK